MFHRRPCWCTPEVSIMSKTPMVILAPFEGVFNGNCARQSGGSQTLPHYAATTVGSNRSPQLVHHALASEKLFLFVTLSCIKPPPVPRSAFSVRPHRGS